MKLLLLANSDWFLYRFNGELARTLRQAGAEVVLAGPPGDYSRHFEAEGFTWRSWGISRRGLLPWQELGSLWRLHRLLCRERPDILHAFTLKTALYCALVCVGRHRPRLVCSITGLGYLYASQTRKARLLRRLMVALGRRVFPRHQMIFLNLDDHRQLAAAGLVGADRGTVVGGSGVDLGRFAPQPWSEETPPWVVLPARLLRSKGIEDFALAAGGLRCQGVAGRFALVGPLDDANPDAMTAAEVNALCRRHGVEYWGFRDDMIEVYRRASIVCLPSFYREGVPTVLLEAAACGRPVVTTDMPGCRDAVVDGVTGRLVPPRDVDALQGALAALLEDPERRRRVGDAGRRRVEDRFSVQRVVESTLEVYRRCGATLRMPTEESDPPQASAAPSLEL